MPFCATKLNPAPQHYGEEPLVQQTSITCMSTIKKNLDEWDAVSSLYLGTEAGRVGFDSFERLSSVKMSFKKNY